MQRSAQGDLACRYKRPTADVSNVDSFSTAAGGLLAVMMWCRVMVVICYSIPDLQPVFHSFTLHSITRHIDPGKKMLASFMVVFFQVLRKADNYLKLAGGRPFLTAGACQNSFLRRVCLLADTWITCYLTGLDWAKRREDSLCVWQRPDINRLDSKVCIFFS